MKKIAFALITSALALGAASVQAQELKPYVGVGVVSSQHKYNAANDTTNGDRKSNEWGGKIYGGVQLDKTWGVEAGYTDFGKSDYSYTVGGANGRIESDAKSFYLAGKGSFPINQQLSMTGKLGVAHNKNDVNATGLAVAYRGDSSRNALFAAVGAEYAFTDKLSGVVEYEHYGKNDNEQGRRKGAVNLGVKASF
ncbi:outer membrane beta-barrel protein [Pseudoduganella sp. DS3]|uniref:Outer membrane beta-barrel protein n=1 Tax=Pseudoduganella guangdongensis TaxID=2692179 RepID=A0A6N9HDN3_9BURK|nr:porin family protein [Pseudoduganella guangdongensis]MYN01272.1 outer membrane beta-barrel protein [Pseudoduganella guangdongensis]